MIRPAIEALKEAGIIKENKQGDIAELLDVKGMSLDSAFSYLNSLVNAEKEEVRLRALEMIFKLHGVLKQDATQNPPAITFVIRGEDTDLNNLLTPRKSNG